MASADSVCLKFSESRDLPCILVSQVCIDLDSAKFGSILWCLLKEKLLDLLIMLCIFANFG